MAEHEERPREPASGSTDPLHVWPVDWQAVWGEDDGLLARASSIAVLAGLALACRLPDGPVNALSGALARVAKRVDRRHARAAREYLLAALGPMPPSELERRVLCAYRHFFRVALDFERFGRRVAPEATLERCELRLTEEARAVIAAKRGCILVSGHIGNWEISASVLAWAGLDPLYGVAKPMKNRPLSIAVQRAREARGIRLLPRRGAMLEAQRILRAGGSIAMLLDQRARKRPILAPFFGRPARCDRSAAVLIKRLHVPVIVGAVTMKDEPLRWTVEDVDVLQPDELAHAEPLAIVTRINQALERMIRAHPEQYFWLHDRYRDTPKTFAEVDALVGSRAEASGEGP